MTRPRRPATAARVLRGALLLGLAAAGYAAHGDERLDADIVRGESVYQRCIGCHSLARNRTGPRHCGVVGRAAGALADFEYSSALRESGIVWSERTLDEFLAAPMTVVPGTTMGFAGVADPRDRRSLIAYLDYASRQLCEASGSQPRP